MHHIIYKTTNLLNGKTYIGRHSTENLDDGYLGSGQVLRAAIKKYGRANFKREILETLSSFEALCKRESQLVNEAVVTDQNTMNLARGGQGSKPGDNVLSICELWKDPKYRENQKLGRSESPRWIQGLSNGMKKRWEEDGDLRKNQKTRKRYEGRGSANSVFGKSWMTNGSASLMVSPVDVERYLADGFWKGRIVKR